MSLTRAQQRTLDAIAAVLQASEPRMAAMFAMFGRLTNQEPTPGREQLPVRRWYRVLLLRLCGVIRPRHGTPRRAGRRRPVVRALIFSQVALAAVLGAVLLGLSSSHSEPTCSKNQTTQIARFTGRAAVPALGCSISAERPGR
jgi:hypothetical protein